MDKQIIAGIYLRMIALKARRQEIIDDLSHCGIEMADFKALLAASDEAIAAAKAQLPKTSQAGASAVLRGVDRVHERWESSSLDWRRNVTQLLVERVELLPGGHSGFGLWNGWRFKPEAVRIVWKDIEGTPSWRASATRSGRCWSASPLTGRRRERRSCRTRGSPARTSRSSWPARTSS